MSKTLDQTSPTPKPKCTCGSTDDVRSVQLRVPQRVNIFERVPVFLCIGCRSKLKGGWRFKRNSSAYWRK